MKKYGKRHEEGLNREKASNFKTNSLFRKLFSVIRHSATIRIKLIASFLVPIAFIIFLGVISFGKAAEGMRTSYESSTQQAINMTSEYIDIVVKSIETVSQQLMNDDNTRKYYLGFYDYDITEKSTNFQTIANDILAKKTTDSFISNIFILSGAEQSVATITSIKEGAYEGFNTSENGKALDDSSKNLWVGNDTYLDENLGTVPDQYAMRLIRKFVGSDSLIVIDMDMNTVKDIFEKMEFDMTGTLAFIAPDGREIYAGNMQKEDNGIFSGTDFYSKAVNSGKAYDAFYTEANGENHLFMYSKIGDSGAMICAIIPKDTILAQADSIKMLTVIIVIIACIIAVLIGIVISYGIDKTIKNIIMKLKKAASGDLTVDFSTKRKDEFKVLIDEINSTFANMKGLIGQVKLLSTDVSEASSNVSEASGVFLRTSEDISAAMDEIEQGVMQQAKDAEECLLQMDNLSQKIKLTSTSTEEIGKIAEGTKKSIQEGTLVTRRLTAQSKQTIDITTDIVKGIEDLSQKSMSIGSIINVINEISNQTNLLSLNASIEAARAGEVGKGFAVVAGEIRNLADQTKHSVNDIRHIIESIQNNTIEVVKTAKEAETVMVLQDTAVKNTAESYLNINESVDRLTDHLRMIIANVDNIEEARASTLAAIENISAVLEEIAASTNSVNQITSNQPKLVEDLNKSAGSLKGNSEQLVSEISRFTV